MTDHRTADLHALQHLFDELFIRTDRKEWAVAEALFDPAPMTVDMTSLIGGEPLTLTPAQLFAGFGAGLHAGKASHHMTTNVRIDLLPGERALITAHGYAWNHLPAFPPGEDLWETWGTYRVEAKRTGAGWRLCGFAYHSRLTRGNDAVRTHVLAG